MKNWRMYGSIAFVFVVLFAIGWVVCGRSSNSARAELQQARDIIERLEAESLARLRTIEELRGTVEELDRIRGQAESTLARAGEALSVATTTNTSIGEQFLAIYRGIELIEESYQLLRTPNPNLGTTGTEE